MKRQPAPVVLPGKSHGQKSLVVYSPRGRKRVGHNLVTKHDKIADSFPCTAETNTLYSNKNKLKYKI